MIKFMLGPYLLFATVPIAFIVSTFVSKAEYLNLTFIFFSKQDIWLVSAGLILIIFSIFFRPQDTKIPSIKIYHVLFFSIAMGGFIWLGRYLVLFDYDMSRDEQMANFDAEIFSYGQLAAQLPAPWNEYANILNTGFMLPVAERTAWISSYLPMNAAIRAVFHLFGAVNLVGPLSVIAGALVLWSCARKIWPNDLNSAVVAVFLYFASGQVLVNGMTSYAMPLHITLNLVWLRLFIQNTFKTDLFSLCVAFVAVGLHQPVFHPLFALPLLFGVLSDRHWRRILIFSIGYMVIFAFWFWWPNFSVGFTGVSLPNGEAGYLSRLSEELTRNNRGGLAEMMANLVRFVSWQHLLLLPLFLMGLKYCLKDKLMIGLLGGIVLTIIVMTIIMPYQGHGFGYRYLHGLIGNVILISIVGWQRANIDFSGLNTLFLRTTSATILMILPLQLYFANDFYRPFSLASRSIDESGSDYVMIRVAGAPFAQDLVINDPFLKRKPIRLIEELVSLDFLNKICNNGSTISRLKREHYINIWSYFQRDNFESTDVSDERFLKMVRQAGCEFR